MAERGKPIGNVEFSWLLHSRILTRVKRHLCCDRLKRSECSFIIVILNYCKVDYKVFIIRNNKLIYLSRMKSCLWGWSCYHYSLAQRPISHRIHMFLATLSIICKCGILGIGCVSIWCVSGRGFLLRRTRPTEVFKLVLSLGAQITRTGTYARTHSGKRAHVLLITMALKQKQKQMYSNSAH